MHVLVGTDGSDEAVAAAASGVALLAEPQTVTVACVFDMSPMLMSGAESGFAGGMATDEEVSDASERERSTATQAIERTMESIREVAPGAGLQSQILEGDAGRMLVNFAEDEGVDTIVVGSQGKGFVKRALLGSVSSHVVGNAPCPVVVVRRGTD